jgi:hypothetical protein
MAAVRDLYGSADAIRHVLSYLVAEREQLRLHGADEAELEANRQAILAMQWHLDRAVGDAQAPSADSVPTRSVSDTAVEDAPPVKAG